jgi:hypothetical protein
MPNSYPIYGPDRGDRLGQSLTEPPPGVTAPPPDNPETEPEAEPAEAEPTEVPEPPDDES